MRLSKKTLLVIINPYAALDHDGMPVGIVVFDPLEGRQGEMQLIGARLTKTPVNRTDVQPKRGAAPRTDRRRPRYETRVSYDLTPQPVPHTAHHIAAIEAGSLIPADEATARIARVPFVDAAERLSKAREEAIARWTQEQGTPPPLEDWPTLALPGASPRGPSASAPPPTAPAPTPAPRPATTALAASAPPPAPTTPPPTAGASAPGPPSPAPAVQAPAVQAPAPAATRAAGTPDSEGAVSPDPTAPR